MSKVTWLTSDKAGIRIQPDFRACVFKHFNLLLPKQDLGEGEEQESAGSRFRWRLMLNWGVGQREEGGGAVTAW